MNAQKKLLIIDDDHDFVDGIRNILQSAGYEVDATYNPNDGFQALQTKTYDLLCLDVRMGRGAEGVLLARKMGQDPVLREIPVLMITGLREQIAFTFPGQAVHPNFVNVDELIEKPVEPELLLERVKALLEAATQRKKKDK